MRMWLQLTNRWRWWCGDAPCNWQKFVDQNKTTPFPQRVRYVVIDFENVQNVDHSSSVTFHDIQQIASVSSITLVFTGLNCKVGRWVGRC